MWLLWLWDVIIMIMGCYQTMVWLTACFQSKLHCSQEDGDPYTGCCYLSNFPVSSPQFYFFAKQLWSQMVKGMYL